MGTEGMCDKRCNFCGEQVSLLARRCPYCGSVLESREACPLNMPGSLAETPGAEASTGSAEVRLKDGGTSMPVNRTPAAAKPLSNRMKVFLTALFAVVPGIGQLAGIITAIVFVNDEDDADRRSFGSALLVSSIVMFFVSCIFYFLLGLAFSSVRGY